MANPNGNPQYLAPRWQPGQSGNPTGRPRGARSKLSEITLQRLLADFEIHGEAVIEKVRIMAPSNYLAAVVSLLPKQQEKIESPFADLTDEELEQLEHWLASSRAKQIDGDQFQAPDTGQPEAQSRDARSEPSSAAAPPLTRLEKAERQRARRAVAPEQLTDEEIEQRLDAALNHKDRT